jgi:uncharacterized protein YjiS (DUF1127 family)
MSCGSTICNSTNTLDAASPSLPDLGWFWKIPLAWLAEIALRRERRHQYRQLLELDDRMLDDIGISRKAAEEARASYLYLIARGDGR